MRAPFRVDELLRSLPRKQVDKCDEARVALCGVVSLRTFGWHENQPHVFGCRPSGSCQRHCLVAERPIPLTTNCDAEAGV